MKILILTLNAWNNSNSTGNTISNLFSELSADDDVANIYCRNEVIDNVICSRYYKVTENDILHSFYKTNSCGHEIQAPFNLEKEPESNLLANDKRGNFLRKYRPTSLLLLRELIWLMPVWKNKGLDDFLDGFSPDIIYMHGHCNIYMHRILDYCIKRTGAKVAMYWGDDMYSRKSNAPLGFLYESLLRRRFRKSINQSNLLFGGSLMLCDEYTNLFGKKFIPFFKECKQVRFNPDKVISNPITIVYAGNLLFGRESMIVNLVKSLKKVNEKKLSHQFMLKIFSNTIPSEDSLAILDDKKNSCFMGCKPYSDVCKEMDISELVLFIESFDKQSIKSTRLSFSTKIIDCLQSTAGILAIGPKEIASIDYLNRNKLGFIISDLAELDNRLEYLANHSEFIQENNKHKVAYANAFHTNTSAKALKHIKDII